MKPAILYTSDDVSTSAYSYEDLYILTHSLIFNEYNLENSRFSVTFMITRLVSK